MLMPLQLFCSVIVVTCCQFSQILGSSSITSDETETIALDRSLAG